MTLQSEETWLQDFRGFINNKTHYHNLGIKQLILKPYLRTTYPPDEYSQKIIDIGDFETAFLYRVSINDMNVIIVLGPQGRGKTNIFRYAIEFSKILGVPFAWNRNLYIGEGTLMHRKYLASRHVAGEQVINDEAEFLNRPSSIQLRDLLWTLSSGRDSGLHFWFCFPTTKDTQFSIWDAHANWMFLVLGRDPARPRIKYKLYYKVTFEHPFYPPEWVEYPYVGATFWFDFLPLKSFDEYKRIKDTIYDEDIPDNWYDKKKIYDDRIKKRQKQQDKEEFLSKVEEIANSNLTKDSKIEELYKIGYPKYKMVKKLKTSKQRIDVVTDDLVVAEIKSKEKYEEGSIFVSTKRKTIEEEIKENMNPNWEDFWPVPTYPKDVIEGVSRLYLTVGHEKVASFIIEGKGEREWQGRRKKVLLLKKESARREEGIIEKNPAPRGGYRYV